MTLALASTVALEPARWALDPGLQWSGRRLRLSPLRAAPTWAEDAAAAVAALGAQDLAVREDGWAVQVQGQATLIDTQRRWPTIPLDLGAFTPRRAASGPGGVFVLDPSARRVWRLVGRPARPLPQRAERVMRPFHDDPDAPRLVPVPVSWPDGEDPMDLCVGPDGRLHVLLWAQYAEARVRTLDLRGGLGPATVLAGVRAPYGLACVDASHLAVLVTGQPAERVPEALVYPLEEGRALPSGDLWPLVQHDGLPFRRRPDGLAWYATRAGRVVPLVRLGLAGLPAQAEARLMEPVDGLQAGLVWHRVRLRLTSSPGLGVALWAGATEDNTPPDVWFLHQFGDMNGLESGAPRACPSPAGPHWAWRDADPGDVHEVLLQRSGRRTRALRGRYLWLRLVLYGDGRQSPGVAGVEVVAPRPSWPERYLPELFQEQLYGPEADAEGPATPADFLERLLANVEGVYSALAERIDEAWALTDPGAAPPEALGALASWLGREASPALPDPVKRALVQAAPELARRHGTLTGLRIALDVVTEGRVESGAIVLVEDWRLRRTAATVLGADLADEQDPLTLGLVSSGSSIVGDTLVLGREERREFLALYHADHLDPSDAAAVAEWLGRLAWRLTVLVGEEVPEALVGRLPDALKANLPAHVRWRVCRTSAGLIVGLRALVGVNTRPTPRPAAPPMQIGVTSLGDGAQIARMPGTPPQANDPGGAR